MLKGHSNDFTHYEQFTCDKEYYSACEHGRIMSSVGLGELSKVCGKITLMIYSVL